MLWPECAQEVPGPPPSTGKSTCPPARRPAPPGGWRHCPRVRGSPRPTLSSAQRGRPLTRPWWLVLLRSVAVGGALKLNLLAGRSPELCPFGERFGRETDKRPLDGEEERRRAWRGPGRFVRKDGGGRGRLGCRSGVGGSEVRFKSLLRPVSSGLPGCGLTQACPRVDSSPRARGRRGGVGGSAVVWGPPFRPLGNLSARAPSLSAPGPPEREADAI